METNLKAMLLVYLVYGTSFLFMGLAITIQTSYLKRLAFAQYLPLLGIFGIIHGLAEFAEIMVIIFPEDYIFQVIKLIFQVSSFVVILSFAAKLGQWFFRKKGFFTAVLTISFGTFFIAILFGMLKFNDSLYYLTYITSRYFFMAPAGLLGAYVLWKMGTAEKVRFQRGNYKGLAISLGMYGFFSGLVVPKSEVLLAPYLNYEIFTLVTGLPVQLFRAFCALLMTYFAWESLKVVGQIQQDQHEQLINLKLEKKVVRKKVKYLEGIRDISEKVFQLQGVDDIFSKVLEEVVLCTDSLSGVIKYKERYYCTNSLILGEESLNKVLEEYPGWDKSNEPLVINDFSGKPDYDFEGLTLVLLRKKQKEDLFIAVLYEGSKLIDTLEKEFLLSINNLVSLAINKAEIYEELEKRAYIDIQTGLNNFLFFHMALRKRINSKHPTGITFLDLENFKELNEAYGYLVGDRILEEISKSFQELLRAKAVVCRYSSARFALMVDLEQFSLEEIIIQAQGIVEQMVFIGVPRHNLKVISGQASYPYEAQELEPLVELAITRLHKVKEIKNREKEEKICQFEKFAALGQMAAGLAHEIRNPLTSVRGFIQLLFQKVGGLPEFDGIILEELDRVEKLIKEFLLLARPSAPQKRQFSLEKVLEEIVFLMGSQASLRDISLKLEVPEGEAPLFLGDAEQIKQVVMNLIKNAMEAIDSKGNVTIRLKVIEDEHVFRIEVEDNGKGIPEESVGKIFDPFYSEKEQGTGLGLAVSYRIVQGHGGTISLVSQVGKGTKFVVNLPLVRRKR